MKLEPYSFRVYTAYEGADAERMAHQVGKWIVHVHGFLPHGMRCIALCVVDDFGDLVVVP